MAASNGDSQLLGGRVRLLAEVLAIAGAAIVLAGLFAPLFDGPVLRQAGHPLRPPHPLVAAAVAVAGLASFAGRWARRTAGAVGGAVALALGVAAAASHLSGPQALGGGFAPSFIGVAVALLLGGALLAAASGGRRLGEAFALTAWALSLPGILRYVFGVHDDLPLTAAAWMSLPTAGGAFLVAGSLAIGAGGGTIARLLASDTVGGTIERRLLAAALIIPPTLGFFRYLAQSAGLLSGEFGLVTMVASSTLVLSAVVTLTSLALERLDLQRREATRQLAAREAQLVEAQAIAQVGSLTFDPATQRMEWSPELFRILGLRPAETTPMLTSLLSRVHPDDRGGIERMFADAPAAADTRESDCRIMDRAGQWRDVHVTIRGARPGEAGAAPIAGTAQDITERKRAHRELAEREQYLATTLRSIGDAVISTNAEGAVVRMNPVAERATGWTFAEASGRPLKEVLHLINETTRAPVEDPVNRVLREGRVVGLANHTALVRRDGTERPIADSAAPIRDDAGVISGVVLVFRDISDERLAEAEQERLRARLVAADRLASIGTLASGVAHEINNPLAYVHANLSFLQENAFAGVLDSCRACRASSSPPADPLARSLADLGQVVAECRDGAERMRHIVRDMKLFSRPDDQRTELVNVQDLVRSTIKFASQEIAERSELVLELKETPPVAGNAARLGQVILNLVLNAAQAMPPGRLAGNIIRVTTGVAPDGRVLAEVKDNGAGIPPAILPRIFDPFFTTKPVGKGTGLGLSISHGLVTSMGGELSVESRVGEGSTFRVLLPVAPAVTLAAPVSRPHVGASRGRVLVVDDEPLVGRALERILKADHDVVLLQDGKLALERLLAGDRFDVILCDLMMPGVSGMELHAALLAKRPDLAQRVLFLSGAAFSPELERFLDSTGNLALVKPVEPAALLAALRRVMNRPG